MGRQYIDVWCASCQRKVTLEEVASDFHDLHTFEPLELAAMQAVSMYVKNPGYCRLS
jgi:hypothetical protein